MISNQGYAVPDSYDVPGGRPVSILGMGERLVFWRDGHLIPYLRHNRAMFTAAGIQEKP